tara:strand:- start:17 stop:376 length:360 start_codon:yes stop_codon:yes gene_type:complete
MNNKLLVAVVAVIALVFVLSVMGVGPFRTTGQATSDPGDRDYCKLSRFGPCSAGEGDCDKTKYSGKVVIDTDGRWVNSSECKTGWCHLDVGSNYGYGSLKDFCECRQGTMWDDISQSCV